MRIVDQYIPYILGALECGSVTSSCVIVVTSVSMNVTSVSIGSSTPSSCSQVQTLETNYADYIFPNSAYYLYFYYIRGISNTYC